MTGEVHDVAVEADVGEEPAAGEELANEMGNVGTKAVTTVDVKAGTYELTVLPGDGYMVKGGFSFELAIKSLAPAVAVKDEKKATFTDE